MEVSDPQSRLYGQFWSFEQVNSFIWAPENTQRVIQWLQTAEDHVDIRMTHAQDFVTATLSPRDVSRLFETTLGRFQPSDATGLPGPTRLAASTMYSIPASLQGSVDFISGLDLPTIHLPRKSVAHAAREHAKAKTKLRDASSNSTIGIVNIPILEARDRAFMAHIVVELNAATYKLSCNKTWTAGESLLYCADRQPVINQFEAKVTPNRNGEAYLKSVWLHNPFNEDSCSVLNGSKTGPAVQLTCVALLGPSLDLVNYVPTVVHIRANFIGSSGVWCFYDGLFFGTKSMTVSNVRRLYKVPENYVVAHPDANQSVANFLGIFVADDDRQKFLDMMGCGIQPDVTYVGPNNQTELTDIEGSIDIQWIQGMGRNARTTYRSTRGGKYGHEPFLDWLVSLGNTSDIELVHSISYGENEDSYTQQYTARANIELMKLGLRGVSVLAATGDTGVQGAAQPGGDPPTCSPFQPTWPASSPWVTSVGGTQFSDHTSPICNIEQVYSYGTNANMPFACPDDDIGEIVCSTDTGAMITSGGGFSNRFPRPSYQDAAVRLYLGRDGVPPASSGTPAVVNYNASNRGYPDVAAVGENVPAVFKDQLQMAGGTSASAPIFAGIVTLLNGERLSAGRPPMGFLNPWLYSTAAANPDIVQDVRVGDNSGGNRLLPTYVSCEENDGFPALPGWDAATGLGSPNFGNMMQYIKDVMELPDENAIASLPELVSRRANEVTVTLSAAQVAALVAGCVVLSLVTSLGAVVLWLRRLKPSSVQLLPAANC